MNPLNVRTKCRLLFHSQISPKAVKILPLFFLNVKHLQIILSNYRKTCSSSNQFFFPPEFYNVAFFCNSFLCIHVIISVVILPGDRTPRPDIKSLPAVTPVPLSYNNMCSIRTAAATNCCWLLQQSLLRQWPCFSQSYHSVLPGWAVISGVPSAWAGGIIIHNGCVYLCRTPHLMTSMWEINCDVRLSKQKMLKRWST